MAKAPDRDSDRRLLEAILGFVAAHPSPAVMPFRNAVADWGEDWSAVTPAHLPSADLLEAAVSGAIAETRALIALFARERASRKWEQSYSKADGVVGDDMLSGYGFAEVIGKRGPFLSTRVRAGIGIWGPRIDYPPHRHRAEEVYVLLSGSADFALGDAPLETKRAGDAVLVPSMLSHGFRSRHEPLVVFYLWQAGDLREKSTFD